MTLWNRMAVAASAVILALAAGLLAGIDRTQAAADAKTVIETRQKAMKDLGEHMKSINDFVEKGEGDAAKVAEHARAIAETAKVIPQVFPDGTSLNDDHGVKTAAKPEIWSDRPGFEAAAANLGERAGTLVTAAEGGDKQVVAASFAELGKEGCGGCHSKFRQKQD
ncbi:MAG TPA: cytochrome c [Alphaproteobacteria bacterium]|nr:cytochrome c [Alphaproteobacteria bacterium]